MSSLGPLTAVFSPPSYCETYFDGVSAVTTFFAIEESSTVFVVNVITEPDGVGMDSTTFTETSASVSVTTSIFSDHYYLQGPNPVQSPSCFPPNYDPAMTAYYSPGLYCPSGYFSAYETSSLPEGEASMVTRVTCCPSVGSASNYGYVTSDSIAKWQSTLACNGGPETWSGAIALLDTDLSSTGATTTTIGYTSAFDAFGIVILYQASDLSTTSTPDLTSTPPVAPTHSTSSSIEGTSSSSGRHLSPGAAAGIGVACLVAVVGLVTGLFYIVRVRKMRMVQQQAQPVADVSPMQNPNETTVAGQKQVSELPPENRATELVGQIQPWELEGHSRPTEL